MKRFEGKVALITGGNSGIGLASAKRLCEEGARVAISGRDAATLASAAAEIGGDTLAVQADVAKLAEIDKLLTAVAQKFGKIDVLFVNAGVAQFGTYAMATEEIFDNLYDINVKGAYFTIQKAIPFLNDGASVILNTSIASTKGADGTGIYASTKAALRSFARTAARELLPRKIRVNAVAPGPITTPIIGRAGMSPEQQKTWVDAIKTRVPMGRAGTAEEVAGAVAFLASADATYITGVELNVDGGLGQL